MRETVAMALTELGKRTAREIGVPWIQRSLEDRGSHRCRRALARRRHAVRPRPRRRLVEGARRQAAAPPDRAAGSSAIAGGSRRRACRAVVAARARACFGDRAGAVRAADAARELRARRFRRRNRAAGVQRLWELATGKKQPEAVRAFAATYLKAHHPDLGPRLPEATSLGIQPRLEHDAYPLTTIAAAARRRPRRRAPARRRRSRAKRSSRWNEPRAGLRARGVVASRGARARCGAAARRARGGRPARAGDVARRTADVPARRERAQGVARGRADPDPAALRSSSAARSGSRG